MQWEQLFSLSLTQGSEWSEGSQGPGGLSFSSLIMSVWQIGKQEVRAGEMEGKREGWEIDDRRQREVREGVREGVKIREEKQERR